MNEGKTVCPGCGRHCDLSMPSCERGEEYARTGVMPERAGAGGHGGRGPHGHPPHGDITKALRYKADSTEGKLMAMLGVLGHIGHHMGDEMAQEMFSMLTPDERETLLSLLERVYISQEEKQNASHPHHG